MRLPYIFFICCICSCAATRYVRPLEEKQQVVSFGVGGPLVVLGGNTIPLPLSNLSYARGFKKELTGFGALHTTSLLFGIGHIEAGVLKGIRKNDGFIPGVSIAPSAHIMLDRWEWNFRFYPQLDMNAYWTYGKPKHILYVGIHNFFELRSTRGDMQAQQQGWLPGVHIGHTFVRPRSSYQLEFKYMAANVPNKNLVVEYQVPKSMATGAFGVFLTWQFNLKKP